MLVLLPVLGVLAGTLTTVAGMGGGVLLVLALSLLTTPAEALAMTAPALLLGNLHRLALHRDRVDRRIAAALIAGTLPGSLLGGALVMSLPVGALRALLVVAAGLAAARALKLWELRAPAPMLAPAGFAVGAMAATGGGAGLLIGPLLLSSGLTGATYVATSSAIAVSMHVGRLLSYGATGLITPELLAASAALAGAIFAGNVLGERARRRIDAALSARLEVGVLLVCVALAVSGVA
jgi:uncharacterized protein